MLLIAGAPACRDARGSCESPSNQRIAEECAFDDLARRWEARDPSWQQVLAGLATPAARDLARMRMMSRDGTAIPSFCPGAETDDLRDWCRRAVERSHLHNRSP